jgi:hypothetical protein
VYTPAGGTSYEDSGTAAADCTVSAADLLTALDTGTAAAAATASAADLFAAVDVGTAEGDATVSTVELFAALDTGTAEGDGTVSADEVYTPAPAGMRLVVTGTPDLSPDCTTPDTGAPAGTYNGYDYWTWTNDAGTWYLWMLPAALNRYGIISAALGVPPAIDGPPGWTYNFRFFPDDYPVASYAPQFGSGATGTATVAEYVPPVATVVTNILLGSTPELCRILNSRIVRGPI